MNVSFYNNVSAYAVKPVRAKPKASKGNDSSKENPRNSLEAQATMDMLSPKAKMYSLDEIDTFKGILIDCMA